MFRLFSLKSSETVSIPRASIISKGPLIQLNPYFIASTISCGEDVISGIKDAA